MRLLLSDPLGPKEEWERMLDDTESQGGQGLLIRFVA